MKNSHPFICSLDKYFFELTIRHCVGYCGKYKDFLDIRNLEIQIK